MNMPMEKDLFVRLVVDPVLYGPIESAKRQIRKWETEAATLDLDKRTNVELGLMRVKRVRYLANPSAMQATLKRIALDVRDNPALSIKYRIVKAEHELHSSGNYVEVEKEFELIAKQLASSSHELLYALTALNLSVVGLMLGRHSVAEEYCQDGLSISRRRGYVVQQAYSLNNYGVLKKNLAQFSEAEKLLKKSFDIFESIGAVEGQTYACNNLAVCKIKLGDWPAADYYIDQVIKLRQENNWQLNNNERFTANADVNLMHLHLLRRRFSDAISMRPRTGGRKRQYSRRQSALIEEFLAEAFIEVGEPDLAEKHLGLANEIAEAISPGSNVTTEILRRQAQVDLMTGDLPEARRQAIKCIRLCRKIGDKYELGASLRVLGEVYEKQGDRIKAKSAFESSINELKAINGSYELMRSCVAFAEFLIESGGSEADIHLLEAKQLCKGLQIDFYDAKLILLSAKLECRRRDFMTAMALARTAHELAATLQLSDRKKLKPQIRSFLKQLEDTILKSSMESSRKLRSIGKIYEDARFPIEELKPEMATAVALNVGASQLFLIRKKNKGFRVPLNYNISRNDAKQLMRFQLRANEKLFESKDPSVINLPNGKTLVCVPGQSQSGYLLCTIIDEDKNFSPRELEFLFASVEAMERVAEEYAEVQPYLDATAFIGEGDGRLVHPGGHFQDILTLDPEMIKVIRLAERASDSNVPILLEGETGVGKELFAQAIHAQSPRKHKQFIAMNAGGVPLNLLESQLFGHVKGAYTDAVSDRHGLIEEARGGTIFFDEVGEMAEELQVKLLRLLENGEFRRLGENALRQADVRVVSATNKDLERRVKEGLFREDLYYRLATVKFRIPPLRNRKRDAEFLVRHFINEGLTRIGKQRRRINVDMKALEAFELYQWPGNVRELKNEILRILSLIGEGDLIRFGMLSEHIKDAFKSKGDDRGLLTKRVDRYERRLILKALEDNEWNKIKTAEQIGIPRTTLLFKMKRLNIVT